ncbi:MAG: S8 family serine peptidase, partial [Deltaproteobacteria bacterium]|nr:S8 family serine peptidase [Deltaproteobacteria bacterium]
EATLQAIKDLASMEEVKFMEEDKEVEMHRSEGVPRIRADGVHSLGYQGSGISIAICDSGVDYTHSELGNGSFPNSKVIGGYDTADNDSDPMPTDDSSAHGTCCAGIAAGDSGGVAPSAKIYALKVFKDDGTGTLGDTAAAWDWCVTHKNDDPANPILIISSSLGAVNAYETSTCDSGYSFYATAAAAAVANGMTLFASSGNDGYCDGMTAPGCITNVISVGAVYDASFGDYSPCISEDSCVTKYHTDTGCSSTDGWYAIDSTAADKVTSYSNSASFLDILASANKANTTDMVGSGGYDSSGDYYDSFGGTSAACPYAAGAGALLQEYAKAQTGSYLTPAQLKSALVNCGDSVTDSKSGLTHPRVNVMASTAAINGRATTTSSTSSSTTTTSIPNGNLTPFTPTYPSVWDYPIVPSSDIGTNYVGKLCAGETTYVDFAVLNEGPGDIPEIFNIDLYIDGIKEASFNTVDEIEAGYYAFVEDYPIVLDEGQHNLKIKADSDNDVAEANESDNEYDKTFTWEKCGWGRARYESILGEESQERLVHLRRFRDEKLLSNDTGKEYVDLLYNHSEEVDFLLEDNPDLSAYTAEVMDKLEPDATALLNGEEITISKELVGDIVALLDEFETEASPALKVTIRRVKRMVKRGTIFKLLGITLE